MKRIFLLILVVTFPGLIGGFAAAQQAKKIPRIGILIIASRNPSIEAFRKASASLVG